MSDGKSQTTAGSCPAEYGGRMQDCAAYPACACDYPALSGKWRHVRMNQPAPEGDDFVVIAAAEYEAWRLRFKKDRDDQDAAIKDAIVENARLTTELEEATLARGRLRLWMEFIQHNCTSPEAREYAGEALNGAHAPEGYDWDERSGRHDFLP